jgi:hypothetical protein
VLGLQGGSWMEETRCWFVGRKVVLVCFVVWVESLGGGVSWMSIGWQGGMAMSYRYELTISRLFGGMGL